MPRLQILQLPEGASDDRAPFVLVIDQVDDEAAADIAHWPNDIATRIGARHVLCFPESVDIPANEILVGPDGLLPLRVQIEPDFDQFREQVQAEATAASGVLAGARYVAEQYGGQTEGRSYDDGAAPSLRWRLDSELAQRRNFVAQLGDALGLDNDPAINLVEAAREIRLDRDAKTDRMQTAAQLHPRIEHRGQTICGHCSAWDGPQYDSTDNSPIEWPCDTIKALTGYTEETTPEPGHE